MAQFQTPLVQGVLGSRGNVRTWDINSTSRPFQLGAPHSVHTRQNYLHIVDHGGLPVGVAAEQAGISRRAGYRYRLAREEDGRLSAMLQGGSEATVNTVPVLWLLCHTIKQYQFDIRTLRDVVQHMREASNGEVQWTENQAQAACKLVDISNKKFAVQAAQRDTYRVMRLRADYL